MSTLATGPVTDAGKDTVSRNALQHGLTARKHAVLPGEEADFLKYAEAHRAAWAPVGLIEEDLVRTIGENQWRLRRAHAIENQLFDRAMPENDESGPLSQAEKWLQQQKEFQKISHYAARIQRTLDKLTADLRALQAERRAAFQQAQEEAIALTHLANAKGNGFEPAHHFGPPEQHGGFVFSIDSIRRIIIHRARLQEARTLTESLA